MFIPLGFGTWPRLFPFAIAFIAFICVGWSFSYFPTVKAIGKISSAEAIKLKELKKKNGQLSLAELQENKAKKSAMFRQYDLASAGNLSLKNVLRATFTHADYFHLFGNLLFLILFGVWVHQRTGSLWTVGVFMTGSFAGIVSQTVLHPHAFVLGASAGISALMGAFFVFFYRSEFHFVFTLGFLYFKRIVMPLLWVFPAFYVMADFTAALSKENNGVAHLAHLIGFLVGCGFGLAHRKLHPVPVGHLFAAEAGLLEKLKRAQSPADVLNSFSEIMKWNPQNLEAIEYFLMKLNMDSGALKQTNEIKRYHHFIAAYMSNVFRTGNAKEVVHAVEHFPAFLPLADYISAVPLRQILTTADFTAQNGYYFESLVLYKAAIPKLTDNRQKEAVNQSISALMQLQAGATKKVSGGYNG